MIHTFAKTSVFFLNLVCIILLSFNVNAEYRAYMLEVFDHNDEKNITIITGFSPDEYVITHGGYLRTSVIKKATWMCYGNTSGFKTVCLLPITKNPKFKKGDQVKVFLEKHITEGWIGVVELAWYREDLKSNVYGIRFVDRRSLYNRYFEFNLRPSIPELTKKTE